MTDEEILDRADSIIDEERDGVGFPPHVYPHPGVLCAVESCPGYYKVAPTPEGLDPEMRSIIEDI